MVRTVLGLKVPGIGETTAEKLREISQEIVNAKVSAYREEKARWNCISASETRFAAVFAAEGMRFSHGHVNVAICMPSRNVV